MVNNNKLRNIKRKITLKKNLIRILEMNLRDKNLISIRIIKILVKIINLIEDRDKIDMKNLMKEKMITIMKKKKIEVLIREKIEILIRKIIEVSKQEIIEILKKEIKEVLINGIIEILKIEIKVLKRE
jgi:hypothetical protein